MCSNVCCKHHQLGNACGSNVKIGVNSKCESFEKGLVYYFHLVWQALRSKNYIDAIELNTDLKIGLYCVMTAYHLGFCEMEWGTCRMIALKASENGPMLKAADIREMPIDTEQLQKLAQDLEFGTLPPPVQRPQAVKRSQPFGWLSPTGVFTQGNFGEHETAAQSIIRQKGFWAEYRAWRMERSGTCRDFLSEVKGYCLIHNPSGSGGYVVSIVKPLTKKQNEFLYEYFMEIGDQFKAEQFINASK